MNTVIQKKSYRELFLELKGLIGKRRVDLKKKHYIIVPDNFTLYTEKLLFTSGGAFDAGVFSFNRLFHQLIKSESYLPRHGAVMLLKKVISENKSKFVFFSQSAGFGGFAEKMYDTLQTLSNCCVPPEKLSFSDGDPKMRDIRLIYEKYLEAVEGKHIDACGRLSLLAKAVRLSDFSSHTFYIAGFDGFTKQEAAVVEAIKERAENTYILNAGEFSSSFNDVELYEADELADQIKAAAKRMREAKIREGLSYGDMCMIAPQGSYMLIQRILSEFNIPFYIDHKFKLKEQALCRYILALYNIRFFGKDPSEMFKLAKNYFSGVEKADADVFENYCLKYCVSYDKFNEPFTYYASFCSFKAIHKSEELCENEARAERVREKLVKIINTFASPLEKTLTAEKFTQIIEGFLKSSDAQKKSDSLSEAVSKRTGSRENKECEEIKNVPAKVLQCAELICRIFKNAEVKSETLWEMFFEGIGAVNVPLVPKSRESLNVGDANMFRAGGYKYMFVADFCDGAVPPLSKDFALISDKDIDALWAEGVEIEPKIAKLNDRNAADFLFAASECEKLFLAYSNTGEKRQSSSAQVITQNARTVKFNSFEDENDFLLKADPENAADFGKIAMHCASVSNASEMFLSSYSNIDCEPRLPFMQEILEAVPSIGKDYLDRLVFTVEDTFSVKDLVFRGDTTSVSVLQDYFLCPNLNFLKNGLKIKERESGEFSHLDTGNFLHGAVEEFVRNNRYTDPRREMQTILDKIVKSNPVCLLEPNKALIGRLVNEALDLAVVIADQINASSFEPKLLEKEFGTDKNSKITPLKLSLETKEVFIKGKIDRADIYKDFIRIIDYKTGGESSAKFDFSKVYFGTGIQLLIYLKTMLINGYRAGGAFFFPCSVSWSDDEFSHRLSGLCNENEEIVLASDNALKEEGAESKIMSVKTKRRKKETDALSFAGSALFTESQIERLCDYAYSIARNAAAEIESGYKASSPLDGACSYCRVKAVCISGKKEIKEREKKSVKADAILSVAEDAEV